MSSAHVKMKETILSVLQSAIICAAFLSHAPCVLRPAANIAGRASISAINGQHETPLSQTEYEIIEGVFHDGLGTYAELALANELIKQASLSQQSFATSRSNNKMLGAINRLPDSHPGRAIFDKEIANIQAAARKGAAELLNKAKPAKLLRVRHVATEYAGARAGDLRLEFRDHPAMPVSVKTDKSGKVAVAEGQTPDIGPKWAERYFKVNAAELDRIILEMGYESMADLKSHYLNVAKLVAHVIIKKLDLVEWETTDFSRARARNLDAVKHLLNQLLRFKKGSDGSRIIIFDRSTGGVKWESLLDGIDIDRLTLDRVSFLPSRPEGGRDIGSEFGIKVDGKTVVSFQIKHRRGVSRGTSRQNEFADITTRLRI